MNNIEAPTEEKKVSKCRRYIYADTFWFFVICTLYTVLYISWFGTRLPLWIVGILYAFTIKKRKIIIFPYQLQISTWLYETKLYNRFVRRLKYDKESRTRRTLGFMMLFLG
jgi:hypothetical protein